MGSLAVVAAAVTAAAVAAVAHRPVPVVMQSVGTFAPLMRWLRRDDDGAVDREQADRHTLTLRVIAAKRTCLAELRQAW